MAPPALPLPPIKLDKREANNVNLQIAAARHGLARATGRHTLRIRNDAVFMTRDFVAQYQRYAGAPRGPSARFRQRLMISWLYTLNPFAAERLPLHFSDWFHFGRTEDVASFWDVPEMTFADATYYRTHAHAAGTNRRERLFLSRLAVEQHFATHGLQRHIDLRHHNDLSGRDLSIDALLDDFVLCDLAEAAFNFPKYQAEITNPLKVTHCLTPEDWRTLHRYRGVEPWIILSRKLAREPGFEPRRGPAQLSAAPDARDEVVASRLFGGVPPGGYSARITFDRAMKGGRVWLRARSCDKDAILAECDVESYGPLS